MKTKANQTKTTQNKTKKQHQKATTATPIHPATEAGLWWVRACSTKLWNITLGPFVHS